MTPEDELESARRVVRDLSIKLDNAMADLAKERDPKQRLPLQRSRISTQLEMLENAQKVYELAARLPTRPIPASPEEILRREMEWGFEPGTFKTTVEELGRETARSLKQDLELALLVTKAELEAAEPAESRPDFVAAVIRICCATVIGTLIGAPLGALAAQEQILKKIAEAAVVVGLGATTAEVIHPLSIKLTRKHEEPAKRDDPLSSYLFARNVVSRTERGSLPRPTDLRRHIEAPPERPQPPVLPTQPPELDSGP